MGFYEKHIFSRAMDWAMGGLDTERQRVLGPARGRVLEIGFGTGRNLPNYPPRVEHLTAFDPLDALQKRVERRIAAAPFGVEWLHPTAEQQLPFAAATFDTVVATFTLCSIPEPGQALEGLYRVLKPGGRFLFLEHGQAASARTSKWQRRLNPVQRRLACGCHLDRRPDQLIPEAGFAMEHHERWVHPKLGALFGTLYEGRAIKAPAD